MTVAPTIVSLRVSPRETIDDRVMLVRKASGPMTAVRAVNAAPAAIAATADAIPASPVDPTVAVARPGHLRQRAAKLAESMGRGFLARDPGRLHLQRFAEHH